MPPRFLCALCGKPINSTHGRTEWYADGVTKEHAHASCASEAISREAERTDQPNDSIPR